MRFTSNIPGGDYSATKADYQDLRLSLQQAPGRDHQLGVGESYTSCSSNLDSCCSSIGAHCRHNGRHSKYALHDSEWRTARANVAMVYRGDHGLYGY
ncbi:hypothetical protein [Citrobacter braakii]|uniref:hypothetical protein n=1 Tax=Citrobacter braakii TaxID=57706 RepID=UPI0023B31C04|nr:hypothetical protein [Citrobacter braakii]MDE9584917.1 hypothetical protein [Citrobacter braakii]